MIRVMSLDPGVSTGVAMADVGSNQLVKEIELKTWTVDCSNEHVGVDRLVAGVVGNEVQVLVIEDFVLYAGLGVGQAVASRDGLAPVRVTARIEQMLWYVGWNGEVEKQMASLAKTTVTNERLKRWGLWKKGYGGQLNHECDAVRHLLTWVHRQRG